MRAGLSKWDRLTLQRRSSCLVCGDQDQLYRDEQVDKNGQVSEDGQVDEMAKWTRMVRRMRMEGRWG